MLNIENEVTNHKKLSPLTVKIVIIALLAISIIGSLFCAYQMITLGSANKAAKAELDKFGDTFSEKVYIEVEIMTANILDIDKTNNRVSTDCGDIEDYIPNKSMIILCFKDVDGKVKPITELQKLNESNCDLFEYITGSFNNLNDSGILKSDLEKTEYADFLEANTEYNIASEKYERVWAPQLACLFAVLMCIAALWSSKKIEEKKRREVEVKAQNDAAEQCPYKIEQDNPVNAPTPQISASEASDIVLEPEEKVQNEGKGMFDLPSDTE